jgi:hypothetical protein
LSGCVRGRQRDEVFRDSEKCTDNICLFSEEQKLFLKSSLEKNVPSPFFESVTSLRGEGCVCCVSKLFFKSFFCFPQALHLVGGVGRMACEPVLHLHILREFYHTIFKKGGW